MHRAVPFVAAAMIVALTGCTASSVHRVTITSSASAPSATLSAASLSAASLSAASLSAATPTSSSAGASPTVHRTSVSLPPAARLPLDMPTGNATRVITVVAPSLASTTATLRAWQKTSTGWTQFGDGVTAHLGTAGLSTHPSESSTATPIGSFTLTQAFGREPDPGTALPYHQTTPADWWISEPGPSYNTMQTCSSTCAFSQGNPNEHLYFEQPYYEYAVVIDYNTANSPTGVRQGAGSAFFLHVTVGQPTQGCISIPESRLVELLRWLAPTAHPRILIGLR